jgi:hypothetical protein
MIRQAINCDICAAEKQESNYWFVAYEHGGELKLRGWESPKTSRKDAKHLCGQKCAQRMMANFMASQMANIHNGEPAKEAALEGIEYAAANDGREVFHRTERVERADQRADQRTDRDRTDRSLLSRAAIDGAEIEADSWAGPARPKEETWETQNKARIERESFLNATRTKAPASSRLQRMA